MTKTYARRLFRVAGALSHLDFDLPSFLQLERSSLEENISCALGYMDLQGCGKPPNMNV